MGDERKGKIRVLIAGHSLAAGIAGIPDSEASARSKGKREWVPVVKAMEPERTQKVFGNLPVDLDAAVKVGSPVRFAQEELLRKKPGQYDVIILFTGGNDVRTRKPASMIGQELEGLYETARAKLNAKKVLIFNFPLPGSTPGPIKLKIRNLNGLIGKSGKIPEADLIDFSSHPLLIASQQHWPQRHPPEEVYNAIRSVLKERVGEWLEKRMPRRIRSLVPRITIEAAVQGKERQKHALAARKIII